MYSFMSIFPFADLNNDDSLNEFNNSDNISPLTRSYLEIRVFTKVTPTNDRHPSDLDPDSFTQNHLGLSEPECSYLFPCDSRFSKPRDTSAPLSVVSQNICSTDEYSNEFTDQCL